MILTLECISSPDDVLGFWMVGLQLMMLFHKTVQNFVGGSEGTDLEVL